ncbi:uncharacterized protein PODANS_6_7990 [Podospora anserina S mat+]|uniref:Podospora anserina S mat+ genomic DNA chromosome 6, supercontig 2 n=1 Tax=Podospora anserina (strain S / ATCC MYA-4624 / DSM 980 / FGSC 10383) TaxID=515849 RepID=B2B427_PODAN|nr:uncharacterized protein PODANS_6_7990 [Podospora anserina S mat+]CAP71863.1 unnamed protein product [Podospora anserina S mat+]CDP31254.1 Putative protein of unknown function [Podospora anserina S mat+]
MATKIRDRFEIPDSRANEITEKVTLTANGMFLYAKVVLDNLYDQASVADLNDELSKDNFLRQLNAAYDRVAARVLDRSGSKSKTARAILEWLVCSPRPLRWREIQSSFCINLEKQNCDIDRRRVDSCKELCRSLVELNRCEYLKQAASEHEAIVGLVHNTARR